MLRQMPVEPEVNMNVNDRHHRVRPQQLYMQHHATPSGNSNPQFARHDFGESDAATGRCADPRREWRYSPSDTIPQPHHFQLPHLDENEDHQPFLCFPEAAIHPSRCPPLDLEFLLKIFHQRQHVYALNNVTRQDHERISILRSQGFPIGLSRLLLTHNRAFPIRIWLIDNSGTMHKNDGHIVTQTSGGKIEIVDCSRWQEMSSTLRWHAELAAWVQTPMVVRFLRDPGVQAGPQQLGVSASIHHSSNEEVSRLKAMLHKVRPTGATSPIHYHLREIIPAILSLLPTLERESRRLVISVCTDSIPTDVDGLENPLMIQEFLMTLQQLMEWPLQVVIRLLTDEIRVVEFYQRLTRENKALLVLDDYVSECQYVQKHNPWLHYGYPLHLCREQGINIPVLEALSKRALTVTEAMKALRFIFDKVHPQDQMPYDHFRRQVETWNEEAGVLWNPTKKRFVPWVNMKKLDKCYKRSAIGGTNAKCNIM